MNTPKLDELAAACWNGACNHYALIRALDDCMIEIQPGTKPVELKIVIGQLSFLLGESLGPSEQAVSEYKAKLETLKPT